MRKHTMQFMDSYQSPRTAMGDGVQDTASHFLTVPTFGYLASNLDFQSFRMSFSIRLRPAVMHGRQGTVTGHQHFSTQPRGRAFRVWHAVLLVQRHLGQCPVGLPGVACGGVERQSSASASCRCGNSNTAPAGEFVVRPFRAVEVSPSGDVVDVAQARLCGEAQGQQQRNCQLSFSSTRTPPAPCGHQHAAPAAQTQRTRSRGLEVSEPSYWRSSTRDSSPIGTGACASSGGAAMAAGGGDTRARKLARKRATR